MLLYFIHDTYSQPTQNWLAYIGNILYYLAACLFFIVIYAGINRVYLDIKDAELIDYQGINSAGLASMGLYLKRIPLAYKQFFLPAENSSAFMYPFGILVLYRLLLVSVGLLVISVAWYIGVKNPGRIIRFLLPLALFPLACSFIYIMCDAEDVHSLMMYSHTMLFIPVIWLISKVRPVNTAITKGLCAIGLCVIILFSGALCPIR